MAGDVAVSLKSKVSEDGSVPMDGLDSEWQRKGATLSDKTAREAFGLTQDQIVRAIRAGKLHYREGSMYGDSRRRAEESGTRASGRSGLASSTTGKARCTGTPGCGFSGARWRHWSGRSMATRSEEHTSELQSLRHLVCRLLLEKKKR